MYFAIGVLVNTREIDFAGVYHFLSKPLHWFDRIFFHIGYDPGTHSAFPGDNHYGVVFYLTLFALSIIGTIVWSLLDKRRANYNKLSYWFNVYLRYVLALIMFGYGIDKFIPIQMAAPDVVELLTPLGEQNRFSVLWDFMGTSPGFQMFTGACEIIGSLFLLWGRTALAGSLLLFVMLVNVVAFNFFYNIPVKLFSSFLLLYALYLISPYFYSLIKLFFYRKAVTITAPQYKFQTNWKRYALWCVMVLVPVLVFLLTTIGVVSRYQKNIRNSKREKLYEVISFVAKDTLPPLMTDSIRWRRLLFAYTDNAIICNMKDEKTFYKCDDDTVKKIYTLLDQSDTSAKYIFNYTHPQKDHMLLTGKWKGNDVSILLKSLPIDSMALRKEKIVLMTD